MAFSVRGTAVKTRVPRWSRRGEGGGLGSAARCDGEQRTSSTVTLPLSDAARLLVCWRTQGKQGGFTRPELFRGVRRMPSSSSDLAAAREKARRAREELKGFKGAGAHGSPAAAAAAHSSSVVASSPRSSSPRSASTSPAVPAGSPQALDEQALYRRTSNIAPPPQPRWSHPRHDLA